MTKVSVKELSEKIPPQLRVEFIRFCQTGEANADFMSYMKSNSACKAHVDQALKVQMAALEDLSRKLRM